jgi:hypothetical protein
MRPTRREEPRDRHRDHGRRVIAGNHSPEHVGDLRDAAIEQRAGGVDYWARGFAEQAPSIGDAVASSAVEGVLWPIEVIEASRIEELPKRLDRLCHRNGSASQFGG